MIAILFKDSQMKPDGQDRVRCLENRAILVSSPESLFAIATYGERLLSRNQSKSEGISIEEPSPPGSHLDGYTHRRSHTYE